MAKRFRVITVVPYDQNYQNGFRKVTLSIWESYTDACNECNRLYPQVSCWVESTNIDIPYNAGTKYVVAYKYRGRTANQLFDDFEMAVEYHAKVGGTIYQYDLDIKGNFMRVTPLASLNNLAEIDHLVFKEFRKAMIKSGLLNTI